MVLVLDVGVVLVGLILGVLSVGVVVVSFLVWFLVLVCLWVMMGILEMLNGVD